jgi:hypothetical protein
VFCANHSIPHEDCPHCLTTVAAMRPTVFAELAAAELRSGTEYCRSCDFVYYQVVAECPRCALPHPFHVEPRQARRPGQLAGTPGFSAKKRTDGSSESARAAACFSTGLKGTSSST